MSSILDLERGIDKRNTIQEIKEKKSMSGANAWMLLCSIMIASLGLDLNSPAVIIGAMLISPLMSPILGIGLSIGINDIFTLRKCVMHFSVAVGIAILTSTLYFWLSPFGVITPEIEARTTPTFLDIFIAFFGGIAGIVSIANKEVSTTVPGVAIATALMPPLCVTGFGIANGEWNIALSSFYLFFLNTFFVSLATFAIVRFLRFPFNNSMDSSERRRYYLAMALVSILLILPSVFIFKGVYENFQKDVRIKSFIDNTIGDRKVYLDDHALVESDSINRLILKVYGNSITNHDVPAFNEALAEIGLKNTVVDIIPTSEIHLDKFNQLSQKVEGINEVNKQLQEAQTLQTQQEAIIAKLEDERSIYQIDSTLLSNLNSEQNVLFPDVSNIRVGTMSSLSDSLRIDDLTAIVTWSKKPTQSSKKQINEYLKLKFKESGLSIIHL